ncbi:MAG: ion transporter [Bacteriovoracaceae bacterium]|nr:ion transporter [Bacteriovoracaceae bacterium]
MSRVRKVVKIFRRNFLESKYGIPVFIILTYIFVAAGIILGLEIGSNEQFKNILDALWWTIVTFSTTGYGDKVPVTVSGKIFAITTILTGVGIVSFLSGTMASIFVDRNSKARRGLMDYKKLKNHLVICGQKNAMLDFLRELLRFNPEIDSGDIVIITNAEPKKIESLKEDELLKSLKFVSGDYSQEKTLQRANVKGAKKVMVLADIMESSSISEVDSKTVMTVLTIKGICKDVYVCAELLDKKYENYLKQVMCDEIHFSMDYNRIILGNASANNGITHVFYELIGHEKSKSKIVTAGIPKEFVNKTYGELRRKYFDDEDRVIVGLLENTGTPRKMKKEALRQAQKTANISKLLENLQEVKEININDPVLLPLDSHKIKGNSVAIFVERM